MTIETTISERIREFRKKRDITQERLADYLNISFQAVSKWERGEASPDIALLPKLALFFNTTTDELLGVDYERIAQEKSEFRQKLSAMAKVTMDIPANIRMLREAVKKYPGDFMFVINLAHELMYMCHHSQPDCYPEDIGTREQVLREIIEIGEKTCEDCQDIATKCQVLQPLCYAYKETDRGKDAEAVISKYLPYSIAHTANFMMETVLSGEDLKKRRQSNLYELFNAMDASIRSQAQEMRPDDKLSAYKSMFAISEALFPDRDYGLHIVRMSTLHQDIAEAYVGMNDFPNAMKYLEMMLDFLLNVDLSDTGRHTSPLFDSVVHFAIGREHIDRQIQGALNMLTIPPNFSAIRDTPECQVFINKLRVLIGDE